MFVNWCLWLEKITTGLRSVYGLNNHLQIAYSAFQCLLVLYQVRHFRDRDRYRFSISIGKYRWRWRYRSNPTLLHCIIFSFKLAACILSSLLINEYWLIDNFEWQWWSEPLTQQISGHCFMSSSVWEENNFSSTDAATFDTSVCLPLSSYS